MTIRRAFLSALHIFILAAFVLGGIFFSALPYLPELHEHLLSHAQEVGLYLLAASGLLLLSFYLLERGRYLVLRMGVSTDIRLVQQCVEDCFARQFHKKISLQDLEIGPKSQLSFWVSLKEKGREELLLADAEKQLSQLLRDRFGYSKPFYFIVR